MEINWYLLFVRTHWEDKVAHILTRKKIETYCPLYESSNSKKVTHPLIPSHVFLKAAKEQLAEIKKLPGIINFVYWLGEPAIVKDSEINLIRRFLSEYSEVSVIKTNVNTEEAGRIISHSFTEQDGKITSVENKKVKAVLPSIGYTLIAEGEPSKVRILSSSKKRISGTNIMRRIRIASKQFAGYYQF